MVSRKCFHEEKKKKAFKINHPQKKVKPDEDREEREHEVIDILMERAKQNYKEKCNHKFEKFRKEGFARINARKKSRIQTTQNGFLKTKSYGTLI